MSLLQRVREQLDTLGGVSGGPEIISAVDGPQSLDCELVALDSLACAFDSFVLRTTALSNASMAELRSVSDALAKKLGYLLESIGAVETDQERCIVQMRSTPPHKGDDGTSYYELLIRRGGELRLSRYRKTPGDERRIIPAHVTREVFLRLVTDFSAAAQV